MFIRVGSYLWITVAVDFSVAIPQNGGYQVQTSSHALYFAHGLMFVAIAAESPRLAIK